MAMQWKNCLRSPLFSTRQWEPTSWTGWDCGKSLMYLLTSMSCVCRTTVVTSAPVQWKFPIKYVHLSHYHCLGYLMALFCFPSGYWFEGLSSTSLTNHVKRGQTLWAAQTGGGTQGMHCTKDNLLSKKIWLKNFLFLGSSQTGNLSPCRDG